MGFVQVENGKKQKKKWSAEKKSGGHRASNKNIRTPSQRKGHQLYILSSFRLSARAWKWRGTYVYWMACALEMRSSNGRERS